LLCLYIVIIKPIQMASELNINKLITSYITPNYPIYKIHYFVMTTDDNEDEDGEIYSSYPDIEPVVSIVEAIPEDPPREKSTGLYKYCLERITHNTFVPLHIMNDLYDPTSFNGLKQIKPVICKNRSGTQIQTIYRIEKLA